VGHICPAVHKNVKIKITKKVRKGKRFRGNGEKM
jgi:hypothetical protein